MPSSERDEQLTALAATCRRCRSHPRPRLLSAKQQVKRMKDDQKRSSMMKSTDDESFHHSTDLYLYKKIEFVHDARRRLCAQRVARGGRRLERQGAGRAVSGPACHPVVVVWRSCRIIIPSVTRRPPPPLATSHRRRRPTAAACTWSPPPSRLRGGGGLEVGPQPTPGLQFIYPLRPRRPRAGAGCDGRHSLRTLLFSPSPRTN